MPSCTSDRGAVDSTTTFYCHVLSVLKNAGVPFLVGGAYALERHTGIGRDTKDFDIFVMAADCERALHLIDEAGYPTEFTFPHWLGKAFGDDAVLDIIFASGNGIAPVDKRWFERAVEDELFGLPVKVCAPEEMIWQKAFILERDRSDVADVAHLLRCTAPSIDWLHLVARFGPYWRVLLAHLVLFGFVYPTERLLIPETVMRELLGRLEREIDTDSPGARVCDGTLLSVRQFDIDIERWGYEDARLVPRGRMTQQDVDHWKAPFTDGGVVKKT